MPKKLSNDTINKIVQLYTVNKLSCIQISQQLNLNPNTVSKYLKECNVEIRKYRVCSPEVTLKIIELYQSGLGEDKIQDQLGITRTTIRSILKKNGIKRRSNTEYRTYTLNETYFDEINTQNKAYILGFWYADGCISQKKYRIQMDLQIRDKYILEAFLKEFECNAPLFIIEKSKVNPNHQDMCYLCINNKHMHSQLKKWGVVPQKTHILKYPDFLSEDLHRHFIRGVLDGDGCIHAPHGKNGKIKSVDISGTYDFCIGLKNVIENFLGIHCSIIKVNVTGTTYRITISGGKQVPKFLDWIYEDASLYLYRKYNMYKTYYSNKS